ncbi:MAG: hypothetical protein WBE46_06355 [Dehalococcoidia bacterium]
MKKNKIRRRRITPKVREAVTNLYLANHDFTGEQIWHMLEYYPNRDWPVPRLRSIQKIFAEVKDETTTPEFQQKEATWNMATLEEHPLPTEAIPIVLKVQHRGAHFGRFTIRQVIWIARLYRVISDIALLDDISWNYALQEKICQLSGTNFDTTKFDSLLKSPRKCLKALENELPRTKDAWYTRKAAFDAITTYTLHEPSYEIYFKGNEAWARRVYQPDVLLGSREEILAALRENMKKERYCLKAGPGKKPTQIPDGDFSIRFTEPIIFDKKLAERFSGNEHPESQTGESGRIAHQRKGGKK